MLHHRPSPSAGSPNWSPSPTRRTDRPAPSSRCSPAGADHDPGRHRAGRQGRDRRARGRRRRSGPQRPVDGARRDLPPLPRPGAEEPRLPDGHRAGRDRASRAAAAQEEILDIALTARLLRARRRRSCCAAARCTGMLPGLDQDRRALPAQGRRRRHLAVELPDDARGVRLRSPRCSPATRWCSSRTARRRTAPWRASNCSTRRGCRVICSPSSPDRARWWARRSSRTATT